MDFVEVARLRGERPALGRLPRGAAQHAAAADRRVRAAVLLRLPVPELALRFLGLGIQPPAADWGGMVRDNANAISFGLIVPLIPAAAIAVLTIGVNLVVDWQLRALLDRAAEGLTMALLLEISDLRIEGQGEGERMGRARQGRLAARSSPRRGPGPDRRIRGRQVDDRARSLGYARERLQARRRLDPAERRGAARRAARPPARPPRRRGSPTSRSRRPPPSTRRTASNAQVTEAAVRTASWRRTEALQQASRLYAKLQPAGPGDLRRALPASGLGRAAAARDDRDGDGRQAAADRVRRADHRARRDDPDRGAGGDQGRDPGRGHGRALYHPRPCGRGPDRGPDHGAEARASWSRRARPRQILYEPQRGLHPGAGQRPPRRARARSITPPASRRPRSSGSPRPMASIGRCRTSRCASSPRPRWPWSANPAPASRRSPGS